MTPGIWLALMVACGLIGFAVGFYAGGYYSNGEFTAYREDEENEL